MVALHRRAGSEHKLPPAEPWALAQAGNTLWVSLRQQNQMRGYTLDRKLLYRTALEHSVQRMLAWEGRLYLQEDDGSVISLKDSTSDI